jgi:hypothetical protein
MAGSRGILRTNWRVDLDLVEGEARKIAEARIAGAEIVHDDPGPQLAKPRELAEHLVSVVDEQALGDLKLEPLGRQPGLAQHIGDGLGHVGFAELGR